MMYLPFPRRLVGVVSRGIRLLGQDLQICFLDLAAVGQVVGEHGRAGSGVAKSSGAHLHGDVLVAVVPRLDLGGGLEVLVPDGPHGQEGVGLRVGVGVLLDVDVVVAVGHARRGDVAGFLAPVHDRPVVVPLRGVEVLVRDPRVVASVPVLDRRGHARVRDAREIEALNILSRLRGPSLVGTVGGGYSC